jgi:hypothetical protein
MIRKACVYACVCAHIHTRVHVDMCVCVWMCVHMCVFTCVCMCVVCVFACCQFMTDRAFASNAQTKSGMLANIVIRNAVLFRLKNDAARCEPKWAPGKCSQFTTRWGD